MLPLCADEGIGTIVWSPLARGRLARDSDAATGRSASDPLADMLYTEESSDRAIIDAVAAIARARGVSRAQVSLARLRRKPVVVAPLVGASKPSRRRAVPPVFGAPQPAGRRPGHRLSRTRPHSWRPGGDGAHGLRTMSECRSPATRPQISVDHQDAFLVAAKMDARSRGSGRHRPASAYASSARLTFSSHTPVTT